MPSITQSEKPSQQVTKQKPYILIQRLISLHQTEHHMKIFRPLQMLPTVFTVQLHFNSYQTVMYLCLHRLYAVLLVLLYQQELSIMKVTTGYVAPTYLTNVHLTSCFPTASFF